ncbi:centrosomal protein CEP135, partial [Paragonimus westermani]
AVHMTTQATHEKFTNIRKRLDQLGYKQPLSLDCLPLVERLFCDLVWTTESLRKARADLSSQLKLRSNVEDYIAPYKADNGRLVRENNELHKQLVLLRQESEEKFRSFKSEYRRLENESADLKIFNTQCIEKLRNYESDARRMAEQIMQLQEKNFQAVVYTPGGQKKQLPFRRQRMDIDSLVPRAAVHVKNSGDNFSKSKNVIDPEELDLLDLASKRCEDLERHLARLEEELELSERKVDNFRQQVNIRDTEIERLRTVSEGGRPLEALLQDTSERQTDRLVLQLKMQVDLLQSRNEELESRVVELLNLEATASQAPPQLSPISTGTQTSAYAFSCQVNTSCQTAPYSQCRCYSNILDELNNIKNLMRKFENGREYLIQRVDALVARERDLVKELSLRTPGPRSDKLTGDRQRQQLITLNKALQKRLDGLESDCQHWRLEAQTSLTALQQLTKSSWLKQWRTGVPETKVPTLSRNPQQLGVSLYCMLPDKQHAVAPKVRRAITPPPCVRSVWVGKRRSASADFAAKRSNTDERLNSELQCAQVENADYRNKLEQTKYVMLTSFNNRSRFSNSIFAPNISGKEHSVDLMQLRQERDSLRSLLDKFERQLCDAQRDLSTARSQLARIENSQERPRIGTHRSPVSHMPFESRCEDQPSANISQTIVRRLECERDRLNDNLRHMISERDSLRDRLHDLTNKGLSEKARLLQRIEDAEEELQRQCKVHETDVRYASDLRHRIDILETERRELLDRIDHLSNYHANDEQLTITERNLQTVQTRLNQVEQDFQKLREECVRLRRSLRQLDQEKDTVQASLDERTERCVFLERELVKREQQLHDYQKSSQTYEQRVLRLSESAAQRDTDFVQMSERVANLELELKHVTESRDSLSRELEKTKLELNTMMHEVQNMQFQHRQQVDKQHEWKQRLDESAAELCQAREMCTSVEQERTDLLKQYRTLTLELDEKTAIIGRLENQLADAQHCCSVRDCELSSWRQQAESARKELHSLRKPMSTLESQCALLTRTAAESEERVRRLQAENEEVHRELSEVRALCDRLERQSQTVQHQLTTGNLETDQLRAQLTETERELVNLRKQVDQEREAARNLETILATSREGEYRTQRELQNLRAELQFTRERLEQRNTRLMEADHETQALRECIATLKSGIRSVGEPDYASVDFSKRTQQSNEFHDVFVTHKLPALPGEFNLSNNWTKTAPADVSQTVGSNLNDRSSSTDSMLTESHTTGCYAPLTESNTTHLPNFFDSDHVLVARPTALTCEGVDSCSAGLSLSTQLPFHHPSPPSEFLTSDLVTITVNVSDQPLSKDTLSDAALSVNPILH